MVTAVIRLTLLAMFLAIVLVGCASPAPQIRTVYVERPRTPIARPVLPVEVLPAEASAIEVFRAYEESLLLCVGYARQLEVDR